MIGKKINQLATELAPATTDLTIIGDPVTGVSKKITLSQIANLFATSGTVTSVAVTETGDALTITGSPITTAGTINIGFAGAATQYVRGDGQLSDFPTSTGGGSSVSYYLNSSVSQGTLGGVAYRQFSKTPIAGAGTDITVSANGYIASYITDANDPALLEVPAGNFNCEFYFSVNSNNHNPYVYAEVYKYDGTTFTLLGSSQSVPEYLTNGTTLSPYYFAVPVTATVLTITDRIAIRIYANVDGRTVTLHTENNHLCQVVTTFSKGLTSLNNLTRQVQFLATGTSGTDFNIASSTATHTFNLPTASATNRGALSSADWTTFNNKQNALTNPITGTGASGQVAFFNGTTSLTGTNNFFWDTANNRLGIGTTTPQRSIEIFNSTADNHLRLSGNAPSVSMGEAVTGSVYQAKFGLVTVNGQFASAGLAGDFVIISQTGATIFVTNSTEKMRVQASGNMCVGNTNDTYRLDVTGTARLTGQLRLESTITDGTNTYTLPSATGTLALTSQLTGGTVTSVGLSSATSGVTIGSTPITTSGTITLAIATASGSQQGLLSSTDWTTFNNKQSALTNPVTGTGTTNYLPKFTGASTIGNSIVSESGGIVSVAGRFSASGNDFHSLLVAEGSAQLKLERTSTSTGLMYLGADNVGFKIFDSGFATRLTLTSGGNLGLGVSPSAWASGTRALQVGSYGALAWTGGIDISMTNNAYYDGTNWVYIASQEAGRFLNNRNTFAWYQAAAGTAGNAISFTQAMTLDASGRLGIGTTSPARKLNVQGADDGTLQIRMQGSAATDSYCEIGREAASTGDFRVNVCRSGTVINALKISDTTGAATFSSSVTAASLALNGSIANSGDAATLTIKQSSTSYTNGIYLERGGERNGYHMYIGGALDALTFRRNYFGTQSDVMSLTRDGNVGIGTTSPSDLLSVVGGGLYPRITIQSTNTGSSAAGINFADNSGTQWAIAYDKAGSGLQFFREGGGNRVYITNAGNVGIGTTAPTSKLHVVGLPTSSSGLTAGAIWIDGTTLKIVT
jgi:hypothetical protein